jgi:calcium/calmodulin-dependent protein kinase (CaM kinase) II
MPEPQTEELLKLSARLLECIDKGDWNTYQELCDPGLTAFEPESQGQLVEGMNFHRFYFFSKGSGSGSRNTTMCAPRVRVMGDVAIVTYVRLTQYLGPDGLPYTAATEETRVWQRQDKVWKHVHFHRSTTPRT